MPVNNAPSRLRRHGFDGRFGPVVHPHLIAQEDDRTAAVAADLINLLIPLWREPSQGVADSIVEVIGSTLAMAQLWDMIRNWEELTTPLSTEAM
jgi:hypothetical protein